jgi:hypothetical protein
MQFKPMLRILLLVYRNDMVILTNLLIIWTGFYWKTSHINSSV